MLVQCRMMAFFFFFSSFFFFLFLIFFFLFLILRKGKSRETASGRKSTLSYVLL